MDALAQLALYESDALREIAAATDATGIEAVRIQFLGKKQGRLKDLQSLLGQVEVSERPALGKRFNEVKDRVTAALEARQAELAQPTKVVDGLDVTLPGTPFRMGHRHPISQTIEEFKSIMVRLGFDAVDGPEIEDEFHNFDALNIPKDHPARDVWDTFYTDRREIPRTHTSSVQIRAMQTRKPPIRVISPGRVFRNETIDATHHASFNQVEGLLVDRHVTVAHLKHTLETLVAKLMGRKVETRFRPAFYPFVEPGLDLDVQCVFCSGVGCSICKGSGYIELIPGGLVHPKVLASCGLNPDEWQGFAFGMGFDRMVMMRYGIDDIRRLYDGRLQLVRQF